jgi:hypothetical protein
MLIKVDMQSPKTCAQSICNLDINLSKPAEAADAIKNSVIFPFAYRNGISETKVKWNWEVC